jgi:hypothetical protein
VEQYLLSLSAISATLLGICVAIICFIDSALSDPNIKEITIGDIDYKYVLEIRGKFTIIAGLLFFGNTVFSLVSSYYNLPYIGISMFIFIIGCILMIMGLIWGRFKYLIPERRKPPKIKE